METSSPWYVFMGAGFVSNKGMNSFHGQFDTMQDAREYILKQKSTGWYQLVKASTMVVWEHGWIDFEQEAFVLTPNDEYEFKNPVNNRGILDDNYDS